VHIEFANRRVLVIGAARGIGRAIVQAFAERGAQVWAGDLLEADIAPLAGPGENGGAVLAGRIDVTDPASIETFVARAAGDGAVDVLVYVAGGVRGQSKQPLENVSPAEWHAIVDANLTGAFLCVQAVAPGMKRAGCGHIVTISSRAGLATSLTGIQSYAAAKHGQVGLVKQLAQELGPFGINVNSVAPGFMATSPDYERQWANYTPEFRAAFSDNIAMRRMGTPQDIAHAVMFLASDYASWITGQVLPVTGSPLV
jgi:3-oxoacyl-[acyl-carrier protein] reductase